MYIDLEKSETSVDTNITFPSVPSGDNDHLFFFFVEFLETCVWNALLELLVFLCSRDRKGSICIWHLNSVKSLILKM